MKHIMMGLRLIALVGVCLLLSNRASAEAPYAVTAPLLPTIPQLDVPAYSGPHLVVNIASRSLTVWDHGSIYKTYPVAVGAPGHRTPLGPRWMRQIVWNPWWLPPDSPWAKGAKPAPPGRGNPLGPVKMDLGDAILMHGTNRESSVGFAASHGCMRMLNADARELAQWIQERVMQPDPAVFATYQANSRRSYYVSLDRYVPVDIVYDVSEVHDGQLEIFADVYGRVRDVIAEVESDLRTAGLDPEKINLDLIKSTIKSAKRKDVILDLAELVKTPVDQTKVAMTEGQAKSM